MENWMTYLLESSCCILGFYLLYFLLLRKETWFGLNRLYLVLTPCIAILIPLLYFSYDLPVVMDVAESVTSELPDLSEGTIVGFADGAAPVQETMGTPYGTMLIFFYLLGVAISSLIFLFKSWSLFKVYRSSEKIRKDGVTIVRCQQSLPIFSFLGCIFLNEDDYAAYSPDEQIQIYQHELAHVTGLHSLDVILMEIFKIVFWFHPVAYAYQWSLQQVHEFIADRAVVARELNPVDYATFLVQQAKSLPIGYRFGNQLFRKPINNRLIMMNTIKSKRQNWIRMLAFIPVAASMIYSFGVEINEVPKLIANEELVLNDTIPEGAGIPENPESGKCYGRCQQPDIYEKETAVLPVYVGEDTSVDGLEEVEVILYPKGQKWVKKGIDNYNPETDGTDSLVWCLVTFPEVTKTVKIVSDITRNTQFEMQELVMSNTFVESGGSEWELVVCEDDRTKELITEVQEMLNHLGYTVPVNGELDAATREKCSAFQEDMGIGKGQLSLELLDQLKIDY